MQQTKRRSKKGVILLALAIAMLVLVIVPAAMAAPASLTINNGATIIGSTSVHLTFNSDVTVPPMVKYTIQDSYSGPPNPGVLKPVVPASVPYVNGSTIDVDYTMQSTATPIVGQSFTVAVFFYDTSGVFITSATATVQFDNTKVVSTVNFAPWGIAGDYSTIWFGPLTVPVRATATTSGAAHSIVFRIDSRPWTERLWPWPNPVIIGGMAGEADGVHTVQHFAVAAETSLTSGPVTTSPFGWDTTAPVWDFGSTKPSTTKWYGNAQIPWRAEINDGTGSGVFPTPSVTYTGPGPYTPAFVEGTPLPWSAFRYEANGSIPVGASLNLTALDMVGNGGTVPVALKWDLAAPHTSYTVTPAGADTISGWTNKDVTVKFQAVDGAPFPNSGVAYTEYIQGNATSTAPAQSASGTQLTVATDGTSSMTVTQTAPSGPRVVWFRSVDKASPANKEVWQSVFIFIDKNAPTLENDVPSTWIDGYDSVRTLNSFGLLVWMDAKDPNSGIGPKLIEWSMPAWKSTPTQSLTNPWSSVAPNNTVNFAVRANAVDDGIYKLYMRVSDRATNETSMTTDVQIDTRPPVTDGASGWINGLVPYVLTGTDQSVGAGVAATIYRVDQATPWLVNAATRPVGISLETSITLTGGQGSVHTIDFGSVDDAVPYLYGYNLTTFLPDPKAWPGPSYTYGNLEGISWMWSDSQRGFTVYTGYKTRTVMLDVTAPVVTAMDPKNGEWQMGPATINFSGTDVGAGYAYTQWSTDGGTTWTKGEVAQVGGNGEITVTYRGVDKVGIMSANQTIMVKVASTGPSVVGANASAKKGKKATFKFNVTSVTPQVRVSIQIRTKSGRTVSTHNYANVTANADMSRSFKVNYPKGKYNIRISAVDQAGNNQTQRGTGTLTVK